MPRIASTDIKRRAFAKSRTANGVSQRGAEYKYPDDACKAATESEFRPLARAPIVAIPPVDATNMANRPSAKTVKATINADSVDLDHSADGSQIRRPRLLPIPV